MPNFRSGDATHMRGLVLTSRHAFKDLPNRRKIEEIGEDAPFNIIAGQGLSDYRSFHPSALQYTVGSTLTGVANQMPNGIITSKGQGTDPGTTAFAISDSTGVYSMDVDTGANDNDEVVLLSQKFFRPNANQDLAFYWRGSLEDVSEAHLFAGVANMGSPTGLVTPFAAAANGTALATIDGIYFLYNQGAATISLVARQDAAADTATITWGTAPGDNDVFELAFRAKGDGTVLGYVRNVTDADTPATGSVTYSNVAPGTNDYETMSWCVAVQKDDGAADLIRTQDTWVWCNSA